MVDSKKIDDVIASPDEDVSHFDDVGVDTPPRPDGLSDEEFYYYIVSICEDRIRHFGALAGDLLTDLRLRPGDDGPDDMFDQHMKEWQGWADTLARVELARSTMLLASMRWSEYQRTADGAETDDGELTMTSKTSTGAPVCASGACQVDTEHEAVLLASVAGNGTDISQQAQWRLRMEGPRCWCTQHRYVSRRNGGCWHRGTTLWT